MRRRSLLYLVAGLSPATGGCLGGSGGDADPDTPAGTPNGATPGHSDPTPGGSTDFDPGWTAEEVTVGSSDATDPETRPHGIGVWNAAPDPRHIAVRIREDGRTVHEDDREYPADAAVRITLRDPGTYRITVEGPQVEPASLEVGRDRFDCNDSRTEVTVDPEGRVDHRTISTMKDCGTATPVER